MYSSAEDVERILTAVLAAGERLAGIDPGDIVPKVPEDSITEKAFRFAVGEEPIGKLIADLIFGKDDRYRIRTYLGLSFGLYLAVYTWWIPLRTQKRLRLG